MSIKNNPLLEEYREELKKVWKNDSDMVDFCIKQTSSLIKLSTGQLYATDKPRFETEFCFGYSSIGQGPSFDECNETMDDFRKHTEAWFKHDNLQSFDSFLERLDNDVAGGLYLTSRYYKEYGANIVETSFASDFDLDCIGAGMDDYSAVCAEDIDAIRNVWISDRAEFEKRLNTYLKRYGTSKLHVWRYWIDE